MRYYGVFASQHRLRGRVAPKVEESGARQLRLFEVGRSLDADGVAEFCFVRRRGAEQGAKAPRRIA